MTTTVHMLDNLGERTFCGKAATRIQRWSRVRGDVTCRDCGKVMEKAHA